MNKLTTLLEIDTCPLCGQEMWLIDDNKKDSFWEPLVDGSHLIACTTNKCCAFRITQVFQNTDKWTAVLQVMEEK